MLKLRYAFRLTEAREARAPAVVLRSHRALDTRGLSFTTCSVLPTDQGYSCGSEEPFTLPCAYILSLAHIIYLSLYNFTAQKMVCDRSL